MMPDPKVTPQILECAEAICEALRRGKWDAGHRQEGAALICEHTGAEMMPEMREFLTEYQNENRLFYRSTLYEKWDERNDELNIIITRLGELGYGREIPDEQ